MCAIPPIADISCGVPHVCYAAVAVAFLRPKVRFLDVVRGQGQCMNTPEVRVPSQTIQKWQEIIDVVAEVLHVPSALVMKVEPPNIKVLFPVSRREIHTRGTKSLA